MEKKNAEELPINLPNVVERGDSDSGSEDVDEGEELNKKIAAWPHPVIVVSPKPKPEALPN